MSADAQTSAPTAPSQNRPRPQHRPQADRLRQGSSPPPCSECGPPTRTFTPSPSAPRNPRPSSPASPPACAAPRPSKHAVQPCRARRGPRTSAPCGAPHRAPRAPAPVAPPRSPTPPSARRGPAPRPPAHRQEIAAEVRRRPVGAVIVDICRDLGITPGRLDRAFWDELGRMIILHGGNFVRFLKDLDRWLFPPPSSVHASRAVPASSEAFPALATGPP